VKAQGERLIEAHTWAKKASAEAARAAAAATRTTKGMPRTWLSARLEHYHTSDALRNPSLSANSGERESTTNIAAVQKLRP